MSGWDTRYMTSVDKAFAEEMQESFENQRRISEAALDMLEALEALMAILDGIELSAGPSEAEALRAAYAAIAKAKGEDA